MPQSLATYARDARTALRVGEVEAWEARHKAVHSQQAIARMVMGVEDKVLSATQKNVCQASIVGHNCHAKLSCQFKLPRAQLLFVNGGNAAGQAMGLAIKHLSK